MSNIKYDLNGSINKFLIALHKYQKASLDMNQSIERLNQHQLALYKPLKRVIETTGAAITSQRLAENRGVN